MDYRDSGALVVRIERLEEENAALRTEIEKLRADNRALGEAVALDGNGEAVLRRAMEERDGALGDLRAAREEATTMKEQIAHLERALGYKLGSPADYLARLLSPPRK